MAKKNQNDIVYKSIQIFEAIILIILGVVICIFSGSESLENALGYCIGIILIVFGLFTIAFSYLFAKGIGSIDTISGTFMLSLGILIMIYPGIVTDYIPMFLGIILIVYAIIFFIETIAIGLNLKQNKKLAPKFVFYLILGIILLVGGILIIIYIDSVTSFINILIGCLLILLGIALLVLFISKLVNGSKTKTTAPAKTKGKSASKASSKKNDKEKIDAIDVEVSENTEVKQIDTKDSSNK